MMNNEKNVNLTLGDWEEGGSIFVENCNEDPAAYAKFVREHLGEFGRLSLQDQRRLLAELTDLSRAERSKLLQEIKEHVRVFEDLPNSAVILNSRSEAYLASVWVEEHSIDGVEPRSDGSGMWVYDESEGKWNSLNRREIMRSIQMRCSAEADAFPDYRGPKWFTLQKGRPVPVSGNYRMFVSIANSLSLQPPMEYKLAIGIRGGRLVTLDEEGRILIKDRSPEDLVTHSYDVDYYEDETLDGVLKRFSEREQEFLLTQGHLALRQLAQAGGIATLGQGCVKVGGQAPRAWLLVDSKELNDMDNVGGTGKSQWVDTHGLFRAFIPPSLISTTEFASWGVNQFSLSNMMGKRLNLMNEAGKAIPGEALELIKKAITGGALDFQRKGQDVETGIYTAANIGAANRLPPVPQADTAFWRRMIPIVFGVKVFDTDLEREDEPCISIIKNELDALFALFMWGYRDVVDNGYARNDEALQEWAEAASYLKATIKSVLIPDNETLPTNLLKAGKTVSNVAKKVREQMRDDGFKVPHKADVERALKQVGFKIEECGNARVVCCRYTDDPVKHDTFNHLVHDN